MPKRDVDFRGKPLHDGGWFGRSEFIEQYPIENVGPRLEELWALGVKAIKWDQYTPAWNDGEPCEFTQNDIKVTISEDAAAAWKSDQYYEGPDTDEEIYDDYDEGYILGKYHREGLTRELYDTPFDDSHYRYAIESEFGNNVTVVITPDETYTFEYECGY